MQENDIFEGMPTVEINDDLHASGNLSGPELGQLTKDVDDIKRFLLSKKRPNETACDEIGMIKELVIGVLVPLTTDLQCVKTPVPECCLLFSDVSVSPVVSVVCAASTP